MNIDFLIDKNFIARILKSDSNIHDFNAKKYVEKIFDSLEKGMHYNKAIIAHKENKILGLLVFHKINKQLHHEDSIVTDFALVKSNKIESELIGFLEHQINNIAEGDLYQIYHNINNEKFYNKNGFHSHMDEANILNDKDYQDRYLHKDQLYFDFNI